MHWEGDWVEPGGLRPGQTWRQPRYEGQGDCELRGLGADEVRDGVDEDGAGFEFEFPAAVRDFEREVAERAKAKAVDSPFGVPYIESPHYHVVFERVEWTIVSGDRAFTPRISRGSCPSATFIRTSPAPKAGTPLTSSVAASAVTGPLSSMSASRRITDHMRCRRRHDTGSGAGRCRSCMLALTSRKSPAGEQDGAKPG